MLRAIHFPLILMGPATYVQVPIEDFENAGLFDISNVQSYCAIGMLQGSTDTYGGSSVWSVEFPFTFQSSCPFPTGGIFIPLSGVLPGDQFTVEHWHKQQSSGSAVVTGLVYSYPATGVLPSDPMDLQYVSSGNFWIGSPGIWGQAVDNFELPLGMPWPSDVYLGIHVPTDSMFMSSTLVDDVTLTPPINTSIRRTLSAGEDLMITLQPAMERIKIRGLSNGPVELFNSAGVCIKVIVEPFAASKWDIHDLPPGIYFVRQHARYVRFVKG